MSFMNLLKIFSGAALLVFSVSISATPVNVNLASSYEIAESLHIKQRLAEKISIHCQYITCRKPEDLLDLSDVDRVMLKKIEKDLIFTIMDRGTGYSDDC